MAEQMMRTEVLGAPEVARALTRIGYEIVESAKGADSVVLLGIHHRGVPLAHRIARSMRDTGATSRPESDFAGSLDITMYRDDLDRQPTRIPRETQIPPSGIDGKTVVLVDDVLFSGRTVRAALDALAALGRPAAVRLAVLIDRGHRELPIRADFVGKNLPTSRKEAVRVALVETDGADAVTLERPVQLEEEK